MFKKRKNSAIILIVLGIVTLSGKSNFAEVTDSIKTYNIDEVVISAVRMEKPLTEIGRSVSLITKNQINNSVYTSPAELLSNSEGISVIGGRQNPGSSQNLYMRGSNSNQTVIMVDGVRLTDPSSLDNAVELSELSLANIQRIEIVRGSHSTLFGSSAIGGVINLITDKKMDAGVNADLNLQTGIFGKKGSVFNQNLMLNFSGKDGFYFNGEIFNTKTNGLDATVKDPTAIKPFGGYDDDNFRKTDLFGKAGFNNGVADVFVAYKRVDQKADIDAGAFADDNNYTMQFKRNLFSYGASYKFSELFKLSFNGGYSNLTRTSINDSSVVDAYGTTDHSCFRGDYDGTVYNDEVQANFYSENLHVVAGAGWYTELMDHKTFSYSGSAWGSYVSALDLSPLDLKTETKNIFAYCDINGAAAFEKLEDFQLALGIRYNNHSTFGDKVTYEINPSYKIAENSLLYFSYATGFNAPSLYKLYTLSEDATVKIQRGNKYLNPEESGSYEFGIKQSVGNNVSFTAAYFNTEVKNYIDYVYLWNKNTAIKDLSYLDYLGDTYLNVGKMLTNGVEFTVAAKINELLDVNANYSLVNGKLKYSPADLDARQTLGNHVQVFSNGAFLNTNVEQDNLSRRANTANLSVNCKITSPLSMRLDVHYVGKKNDIVYNPVLGPYGALGSVGISDYTLFDLSAKYNFLKSFTAIIKVDNIFNKSFTELRGYTTIGRAAYLSVRYGLHY